jgi:hypothetical protein
LEHLFQGTRVDLDMGQKGLLGMVKEQSLLGMTDMHYVVVGQGKGMEDSKLRSDDSGHPVELDKVDLTLHLRCVRLKK